MKTAPPLAIGKKGQNVRLAAKLTHWDIDVMSKEESDHLAEQTMTALNMIEDISEDTRGRLVRLGYTLRDLARSNTEDLLMVRDLSEEEATALAVTIQQEVDAAIEFAENSPDPDPSTLLEDVYTSLGGI